MKFEKSAENLINAIKKCSCAFTTAAFAMQQLKSHGFVELKMTELWELEAGGNYFVNVYDSGVFAFSIGKCGVEGRLKIVAAHTDHPCLSIKPNPEMKMGEYGKLNIEVYGGAILNTWLDRPLSVAGKVTLKSDDVFSPIVRIIDFERPILTIPNLAIHLNRDVNKGMELNRQIDMIPLGVQFDGDSEELSKEQSEHFFLEYLAEELDVSKAQILDFELYVYNAEEGCVLGMNNDFISAPRLDNITSVAACLAGIIEEPTQEGIHMIALYDNEEIGSKTKQGADSALLAMILEKIYESFDIERAVCQNQILDGFLLSVDVAHAMHPNKSEKADPTNKVLFNHGIVIKRSASQSYATDCESIAILEQICQRAEIPYQKYANRSDATSGSTLGTIANKYIPMRSADIGIAILGMHSARETMGLKDQAYLEEFIKVFFAA